MGDCLGALCDRRLNHAVPEVHILSRYVDSVREIVLRLHNA